MIAARPTAFAAIVFAFLAFVLAAQPARAAPTFPTLTGRVVDDAHVLSPATQAELTQELAALEQKTSRQLVVVTVPTLQGYDIADYGYQLGRAWGIGQKQTNNGALFIVAPSEHKVRIEVGYGLEGVLTDAMSNVILQREVLPRFRQNNIEGGVVAGTRALVEQLGLDTSTAEQKAAEAAQQQADQTRYQGRRHGNPLAGLIVFLVLFFVIGGVLRGTGGLGGFLGGMFLGSLLGGGRRYDDDRWGGGGGFGGGGGGFGGGGGGSFGGGGSSGNW